MSIRRKIVHRGECYESDNFYVSPDGGDTKERPFYVLKDDRVYCYAKGDRIRVCGALSNILCLATFPRSGFAVTYTNKVFTFHSLHSDSTPAFTMEADFGAEIRKLSVTVYHTRPCEEMVVIAALLTSVIMKKVDGTWKVVDTGPGQPIELKGDISIPGVNSIHGFIDVPRFYIDAHWNFVYVNPCYSQLRIHETRNSNHAYVSNGGRTVLVKDDEMKGMWWTTSGDLAIVTGSKGSKVKVVNLTKFGILRA